MKFPLNAHKVFQGEIFSVYQWEQKLYNDTIATFEGIKRLGTIQIIPTIGDRICISHEEQPTKPRMYTLLGGRQEPNEEPLITAKRELLEESGLVSDNWELYKTYENEGKIDWTTYLFIARNCTKMAEQKLDPGEKIDVQEVSFEAFLEIVSTESFWGKTIANDIMRMRLDESLPKQFHQRLFPHSQV
jgi:ADP-ribose pyrophosphatase YjhB (NUDIX family)